MQINSNDDNSQKSNLNISNILSAYKLLRKISVQREVASQRGFSLPEVQTLPNHDHSDL